MPASRSEMAPRLVAVMTNGWLAKVSPFVRGNISVVLEGGAPFWV